MCTQGIIRPLAAVSAYGRRGSSGTALSVAQSLGKPGFPYYMSKGIGSKLSLVLRFEIVALRPLTTFIAFLGKAVTHSVSVVTPSYKKVLVLESTTMEKSSLRLAVTDYRITCCVSTAVSARPCNPEALPGGF